MSVTGRNVIGDLSFREDEMAHTFNRRTFVKLGGIAAGIGGASILSGCGSSSGSGANSDTIKVGIMGPYTGDVAQYGLAVRAGADQ